jgi:CMP-N-acetylneuraminate monooxygenase
MRMAAESREQRAEAVRTGAASEPRFPNVDVRLHAHACLEVEHRGFRLLMDPWLAGPAFLGAWTQYPPPLVRASELAPDAILITHEHSDHFHEPTLDQFARSTPILVPDFPNQRMPRILHEMGFADVRALAFGEATPIADRLCVTAYEPDSIWNDAILLVDVAGFRVLNLNDAGINRRIEPLVSPVDLIAAKANDMLEKHRENLGLYGASHLLPCGAFAAPWDSAQSFETPTFAAIQRAVGGAATLLPLLPGSSWNAATEKITHASGGIEPTPADAAAYCRRTFDADLAAICRQPARMVSHDELAKYFVRLNQTPEAGFCEDMTARVVVYGECQSDVRFELGLIIADGRIGITSGQPPRPDLTLALPQWAVSKVVLEDLSWDELRLGMWGTYHPPSDARHTAFWRLLQAPYYHCPILNNVGPGRQIMHTTVMVNIIEHSGAQAERILRRYGLHDSATLRSARQPLAAAAACHGLDPAAIDRLVGELRRACA